MADLMGTCEQRFEGARAALARNLDSGEELGASLVVDIDGDIVVDLWGGFCDEARAVTWSEHTITNVWSSTKTVTSLAALMLADRGSAPTAAPSTARPSTPQWQADHVDIGGRPDTWPTATWPAPAARRQQHGCDNHVVRCASL